MISIIDNQEQAVIHVFIAICSMSIQWGFSCEKLLDSYDRYKFYNENRMETFKDFLR